MIGQERTPDSRRVLFPPPASGDDTTVGTGAGGTDYQQQQRSNSSLPENYFRREPQSAPDVAHHPSGTGSTRVQPGNDDVPMIREIPEGYRSPLLSREGNSPNTTGGTASRVGGSELDQTVNVSEMGSSDWSSHSAAGMTTGTVAAGGSPPPLSATRNGTTAEGRTKAVGAGGRNVPVPVGSGESDDPAHPRYTQTPLEEEDDEEDEDYLYYPEQQQVAGAHQQEVPVLYSPHPPPQVTGRKASGSPLRGRSVAQSSSTGAVGRGDEGDTHVPQPAADPPTSSRTSAPSTLNVPVRVRRHTEPDKYQQGGMAAAPQAPFEAAEDDASVTEVETPPPEVSASAGGMNGRQRRRLLLGEINPFLPLLEKEAAEDEELPEPGVLLPVANVSLASEFDQWCFAALERKEAESVRRSGGERLTGAGGGQRRPTDTAEPLEELSTTSANYARGSGSGGGADGSVATPSAKGNVSAGTIGGEHHYVYSPAVADSTAGGGGGSSMRPSAVLEYTRAFRAFDLRDVDSVLRYGLRPDGASLGPKNSRLPLESMCSQWVSAFPFAMAASPTASGSRRSGGSPSPPSSGEKDRISRTGSGGARGGSVSPSPGTGEAPRPFGAGSPRNHSGLFLSVSRALEVFPPPCVLIVFDIAASNIARLTADECLSTLDVGVDAAINSTREDLLLKEPAQLLPRYAMWLDDG